MVLATEGIYGISKPTGIDNPEAILRKRRKKWPRSSRETHELFHIMVGDIHNYKVSPTPSFSKWGLCEQMYRPSARITSLQEKEPQVRRSLSMVPMMANIEPRIALTPETVEKAFGKGSWEVLNRGLVYLGDLRKAIS